MRQGKYDVVVIGSGLGGLSAGARLAKSGYKTLLVEKLDRVGGRFSTVEHEGFKLPTGAIVLHKGGEVEQFLKELGIKVELIDFTPVFYRIEGKDYEIPGKGRVRAFFDIVNRLEENKAKLVGGVFKEIATQKVMAAFGRGLSEPEKEEGLTLKDWLMQFTDNKVIHAIFDAIVVLVMNPHSDEILAAEFFRFMATMGGMREMAIAPNGNLVFGKQIADVIRANGDVWTSCPAKKIVIKNGVATGVVIQKGGSEVEIDAKVVISDVGVKRTVELAGKENFGAEYLAEMKRKIRPVPVVMFLLASDKPLALQGGEVGSLITIGCRRMMSALPLTNACPGLAPPGQHLLYGISAPVSSLTPMPVKEDLELLMLDIKEQFPDFGKHGRVLKLDARNIDDEFPELRTWPGWDMPRETPVKNLYNVGDSVKSPGMSGTSAAVETGKRVAETVKKLIKPG